MTHATREPVAGPSVKSEAAFRTISEVAVELEVPQHVLRFWETRFAQVRPLKRGGGRRYYRPADVVLLRRIRDLLYGEGYTIKGVQQLLRAPGGKPAEAPPSEAPAPEPEQRRELERLLREMTELRDLLRQATR